jgi:hypothetical protein
MVDQRREIDWASAEVSGGDVVVALTGDASNAWSERFDGVLALLAQSGARWDEIAVTKKAVKISSLQAGAEDELRHFLESVVVQVNSELAPEADDATGAEPGDPQGVQDAEMGEKLRSFSEQQD